LDADDGAAADSITYSAVASAILKHWAKIKDWEFVEEIMAGLEYCADALRDEAAAGNQDQAIKRTLKKMKAKLKRLTWLLGTRASEHGTGSAPERTDSEGNIDKIGARE
jgi:hypothetical protein